MSISMTLFNLVRVHRVLTDADTEAEVLLDASWYWEHRPWIKSRKAARVEIIDWEKPSDGPDKTHIRFHPCYALDAGHNPDLHGAASAAWAGQLGISLRKHHFRQTILMNELLADFTSNAR